MSLRARLAALFFSASMPVRAPGLPRVSTTITDGRVSPERADMLIEAGRESVKQLHDDVLARTHVERAGHFDAPRFGA